MSHGIPVMMRSFQSQSHLAPMDYAITALVSTSPAHPLAAGASAKSTAANADADPDANRRS
jgi:hypothetical protein